MRLWSIHPRYLDARGLVALWREALLAQKVLQGLTRGYRHHPQLQRFRAAADPLDAVGIYLRAIADEAGQRRYRFDRNKIAAGTCGGKIPVTSGQLLFELRHLARKLQQRSPGDFCRLPAADKIQPHPLFYRIGGDIEAWEVPAPRKEDPRKELDAPGSESRVRHDGPRA